MYTIRIKQKIYLLVTIRNIKQRKFRRDIRKKYTFENENLYLLTLSLTAVDTYLVIRAVSELIGQNTLQIPESNGL